VDGGFHKKLSDSPSSRPAEMIKAVGPETLFVGSVLLKRVTKISDIGAPLWCRWLNDRSVTKYMGSGGHWTPARLSLWFSARIGSLRQDQHRHTRFYAILLGPTPVGTLKLENVGRGSCGNIGLMVGEPNAWASGVATLALRAACRAAKKAGCTSTWAGIILENRASRRAFDEAGFKEIAVQAGADVLFLTEKDLPAEISRRVYAWAPRPPKIAVMRRV